MNFIRKHRSVDGFTLIELMITIAVVAVLVALAVPAYSDYSIRAKVAECIHGAAVAKVGISEYRTALGSWPTSLEEAGLESAGISQFCTAINDYESATGSFTVDINEAAIDPLLSSLAPVLIPTERSSFVIDWRCTKGPTLAENLRYLPATCRGT